MDKLGWICLSLVSLSGPLWALPVVSSGEVSYWLPASEEDARLTLEALNSRNSRPFQQTPTGLLGAQAEDNPRKTACLMKRSGDLKSLHIFCDLFIGLVKGLRPNSSNPRESVKEALFGNLPRNMLLSRMLAANRKQYRKRGSLSECFWKYCV